MWAVPIRRWPEQSDSRADRVVKICSRAALWGGPHVAPGQRRLEELNRGRAGRNLLAGRSVGGRKEGARRFRSPALPPSPRRAITHPAGRRRGRFGRSARPHLREADGLVRWAAVIYGN